MRRRATLWLQDCSHAGLRACWLGLRNIHSSLCLGTIMGKAFALQHFAAFPLLMPAIVRRGVAYGRKSAGRPALACMLAIAQPAIASSWANCLLCRCWVAHASHCTAWGCIIVAGMPAHTSACVLVWLACYASVLRSHHGESACFTAIPLLMLLVAIVRRGVASSWQVCSLAFLRAYCPGFHSSHCAAC